MLKRSFLRKYPELNPADIKTYLASDRASKVKTGELAVPPARGMSVREFLQGLPDILRARDLLDVARDIVQAKKEKRPVIAMFGGHVIKCGCAPVLIDLAEKGFISCFASNGAAIIHDAELAAWGQTSEDVAAQLDDGSFGMARDTAEILNTAAKAAREKGLGFGQSVGCLLNKRGYPHINNSIAAASCRMKLPYTMHVAIGTDIVHQHPDADGAAIGEASLRDFRIFAAAVSELGEGGVLLNLGSAVIMPEVFLKALSLARNLGYQVRNFTAVNMDMIQHYRPSENVVRRPVSGGGRGYSITGHHEIMIPLLAAAVCEFADE